MMDSDDHADCKGQTVESDRPIGLGLIHRDFGPESSNVAVASWGIRIYAANGRILGRSRWYKTLAGFQRGYVRLSVKYGLPITEDMRRYLRLDGEGRSE